MIWDEMVKKYILYDTSLFPKLLREGLKKVEISTALHYDKEVDSSHCTLEKKSNAG